MTTIRNQYALDGRRVIVAGGGGDIGLAIARGLVRAGSRVEIWDIAPCQDWTGDSSIVDVTDPEAVHQTMAAAANRLGGLDTLVYAVGATGPTLAAQHYDSTTWMRVIDINLNGAFHCAHAALAHMDPNVRGDIVNIASIAGKDGNPRMAAYSAAKAGLIAMTKSIGRELAHTRIRTHAIAPALIATRLLEQMSPEAVEENRNKIPMRRTGTPDEVAELAAWLISPGCTFSTGAVHDLSGGRATH
tara:strand:+ start:815 stop:1549 length:735 start_codon:yes stop_codon:yes gene_type:complete